MNSGNSNSRNIEQCLPGMEDLSPVNATGFTPVLKKDYRTKFPVTLLVLIWFLGWFYIRRDNVQRAFTKALESLHHFLLMDVVGYFTDYAAAFCILNVVREDYKPGPSNLVLPSTPPDGDYRALSYNALKLFPQTIMHHLRNNPVMDYPRRQVFIEKNFGNENFPILFQRLILEEHLVKIIRDDIINITDSTYNNYYPKCSTIKYTRATLSHQMKLLLDEMTYQAMREISSYIDIDMKEFWQKVESQLEKKYHRELFTFFYNELHSDRIKQIKKRISNPRQNINAKDPILIIGTPPCCWAADKVAMLSIQLAAGLAKL